MGESNKIRARVQHKHKTEAKWRLDVYDAQGELREDQFIPLDGEMVIFDKDEQHDHKRFKFGDGKTNVIDLPFDVDDRFEEYYTKSEVEELITKIVTEALKYNDISINTVIDR